jgi:hypothetical protein
LHFSREERDEELHWEHRARMRFHAEITENTEAERRRSTDLHGGHGGHGVRKRFHSEITKFREPDTRTHL